MGRGAYDMTDPSDARSSAATWVLQQHEQDSAEADRQAEVVAAAEAEQKLIRSKKSRGIMAAKKVAKERAASTSGGSSGKGESGAGAR